MLGRWGWKTIRKLRKGDTFIFLAQEKLVLIEGISPGVIFRPETDFVDLCLEERWRGDQNDLSMPWATVRKCNIHIPTSNLSFENNLKTDFQDLTAGANSETFIIVCFVCLLVNNFDLSFEILK